MVLADPDGGQFHGLIAVRDNPDVLTMAAHAGTQPGCGDCVWTLGMMCLVNSPVNPHDHQLCAGAAQAIHCGRDQSAFRLYLSTARFTNSLVDTMCLGGAD